MGYLEGASAADPIPVIMYDGAIGRGDIGPEVTSEKGEEKRKYLAGYLGFATKTKLTSAITAGTLLATAISSSDVSISDASFANLPNPPSGSRPQRKYQKQT